MSHQSPALLAITGTSEDGQLVVDHRQLAALSQAAAAADHAASSVAFAEYRAQLAARTRSAHDQDLARCALYLADMGVAVGALAAEPAAWAGCTWGLVEGFKRWMLREGYALATLNRTLATSSPSHTSSIRGLAGGTPRLGQGAVGRLL